MCFGSSDNGNSNVAPAPYALGDSHTAVEKTVTKTGGLPDKEDDSGMIPVGPGAEQPVGINKKPTGTGGLVTPTPFKM